MRLITYQTIRSHILKSLLFYYLIELQFGFLPGGSDTTIRHNTQKYTYDTKYHTTLEQITSHKAMQTIEDTVHTMDTTQKKYSYPR
jgi:hypothetical protein